MRITEEFYRQGDLERSLGMPVTPVHQHLHARTSVRFSHMLSPSCPPFPRPLNPHRDCWGQVCDRDTASRVGLQRGFAAFIAPLHCGLAALLPGLAPIAARLAETRAMWDACDSDRLDDEARKMLASGAWD